MIRIDTATLTVTHICDGEEVVTGGADGQQWVATFATARHAEFFVKAVQETMIGRYLELPDPDPVYVKRFAAKSANLYGLIVPK